MTFSAEFNNCYLEPCVNGTCIDGDNTYTCSCFDKYKGTDCDGEVFFSVCYCQFFQFSISVKFEIFLNSSYLKYMAYFAAFSTFQKSIQHVPTSHVKMEEVVSTLMKQGKLFVLVLAILLESSVKA